jgi:hypothetical protein
VFAFSKNDGAGHSDPAIARFVRVSGFGRIDQQSG